MLETLQHRFENIAPHVDFCSLRYVNLQADSLCVRQNTVEPPHTEHHTGAMVTVIHQHGLGYAATSDVSEAGLQDAAQRACEWANCSRAYRIADYSAIRFPVVQGNYRTSVEQAWDETTLTDKLDLLKQANQQAQIDQRIVDVQAMLWFTQQQQIYLTNQGTVLQQQQHTLYPFLNIVANQGMETQCRSFKSGGQQGGLEILRQLAYQEKSQQLAQEALQLLSAPNCPSDRRDLLLLPDQMMLQIHESIGHPLELDRILGDERNYAGCSFVDLSMFGSYQYGSPLLNVTFDPNVPQEMASYAYDDDGMPAEKQYLIRDGILEKPLGGGISQFRAQCSGVANARACSWNRPAIDRIANLNLEPIGNQSLDDLIAGTEKGILMHTNTSWSIDDSRNKFQFGCEWGQLIENGELTQTVKNPNYRGISSTFWRSLRAVGGAQTFAVHGVPFCGKGEPNQVVTVGHASPACVFADVDVFGGE